MRQRLTPHVRSHEPDGYLIIGEADGGDRYVIDNAPTAAKALAKAEKYRKYLTQYISVQVERYREHPDEVLSDVSPVARQTQPKGGAA